MRLERWESRTSAKPWWRGTGRQGRQFILASFGNAGEVHRSARFYEAKASKRRSALRPVYKWIRCSPQRKSNGYSKIIRKLGLWQRKEISALGRWMLGWSGI